MVSNKASLTIRDNDARSSDTAQSSDTTQAGTLTATRGYSNPAAEQAFARALELAGPRRRAPRAPEPPVSAYLPPAWPLSPGS